MSEPDTKSSNVDSFTTAIPIALFFLLLLVFLFQFKDAIPAFNIILWVVVPIIVLFVVAGVNVILQYSSCRKTNVGKAILGSLSSVAAVLIGLGISAIKNCRIPVASVFAPLIIKKPINIITNKSTININSLKNNNSKECCVPKMTLDMVENRYPFIEGLSYGFYTMFSILFGMIIGSSISSIC